MLSYLDDCHIISYVHTYKKELMMNEAVDALFMKHESLRLN